MNPVKNWMWVTIAGSYKLPSRIRRDVFYKVFLQPIFGDYGAGLETILTEKLVTEWSNVLSCNHNF